VADLRSFQTSPRLSRSLIGTRVPRAAGRHKIDLELDHGHLRQGRRVVSTLHSERKAGSSLSNGEPYGRHKSRGRSSVAFVGEKSGAVREVRADGRDLHHPVPRAVAARSLASERSTDAPGCPWRQGRRCGSRVPLSATIRSTSCRIVGWVSGRPPRRGTAAADQVPMPAQHRLRRDEQPRPSAARNQPARCGLHSPVCPRRPRSGDLPAQHGQLMAQDEDLRVLRRAAAGDQAEPTHRSTQDQVQQSERHEPAIMPDALRQRTARSDRMDDILGTHRLRFWPSVAASGAVVTLPPILRSRLTTPTERRSCGQDRVGSLNATVPRLLPL
jgi:hypothetical protein